MYIYIYPYTHVGVLLWPLPKPFEGIRVLLGLPEILGPRKRIPLQDTVATLRKGGSVLIPADVAGWIPEAMAER